MVHSWFSNHYIGDICEGKETEEDEKFSNSQRSWQWRQATLIDQSALPSQEILIDVIAHFNLRHLYHHQLHLKQVLSDTY